MRKRSVQTRVGGVILDSPLIVASGVWPLERDLWPREPLPFVGAACTKGITLEPREGNPGVRLWETPAGVLNSVGLQNGGVRSFVEKDLPEMARGGGAPGGQRGPPDRGRLRSPFRGPGGRGGASGGGGAEPLLSQRGLRRRRLGSDGGRGIPGGGPGPESVAGASVGQAHPPSRRPCGHGPGGGRAGRRCGGGGEHLARHGLRLGAPSSGPGKSRGGALGTRDIPLGPALCLGRGGERIHSRGGVWGASPRETT